MTTPEEFYTWFRAEAEMLPLEVRLAVQDAISERTPRLAYLGLHELNEAGELPASWKPVLDEFYSRFY